MRRFVLVIFYLSTCFSCFSEIVINEVFYDAIGSDNGKEWIELYNSCEEDVNLQGWHLQAGGSSFSDILIFPSITIRQNSFFLISEEAGPLTNLVAELAFENGGSASDGIRILNPQNHYQDTILYDKPNSNNLEGDIPQMEACEPASPGQSLARLNDGFDSNQTTDWVRSSQVSPGLSNNLKKIVTLGNCSASNMGIQIQVSTIILNLSTVQVDKSDLSIKITINNELIYYKELDEITALDSLTCYITIENENYTQADLLLELINNANVQIVDNLWETHISFLLPSIKISEVMHSPLTGNSEWIEIRLLDDYENISLKLLDNAGNHANAMITGYKNDLIVIAEDKSKVVECFTDCDSSLVVQAQAWPRLNNNGDKLTIKYLNTSLDSLIYGNNSTRKGYSYEYQNETNTWHECCFPTRASPTRENSTYSQDQTNYLSSFKIHNKLISRTKNKVFEVSINSTNENDYCDLKIYDIRGSFISTISSEKFNQDNDKFTWNGYIKGKYLASGIYPAILRLRSQSGKILKEKKIFITINR